MIYNSKGKEKKIEMEVGGEVLRTADSEKLLGLHINSDLKALHYPKTEVRDVKKNKVQDTIA